LKVKEEAGLDVGYSRFLMRGRGEEKGKRGGEKGGLW